MSNKLGHDLLIHKLFLLLFLQKSVIMFPKFFFFKFFLFFLTFFYAFVQIFDMEYIVARFFLYIVELLLL